MRILRNSWVLLVVLLGLASAGAGCADEGSGPPGDAPPEQDCHALPFGPQRIAAQKGATRERNFPNTSGPTRRFERVSLNPPFFSDVPASGLSVAPGERARIRFIFRPTSAGRAEATASIVHNQGS